jgi:hypothetical protein
MTEHRLAQLLISADEACKRLHMDYLQANDDERNALLDWITEQGRDSRNFFFNVMNILSDAIEKQKPAAVEG